MKGQGKNSKTLKTSEKSRGIYFFKKSSHPGNRKFSLIKNDEFLGSWRNSNVKSCKSVKSVSWNELSNSES